MRRISLTLVLFSSLNAMIVPHSVPHLAIPLQEIVVTDDHGLVERIPVGQQALDKEMSQWMIHELMSSNKDLQDQLAATKKKWYVITAGIATTVIPLVICGVELYNVASSCE